MRRKLPMLVMLVVGGLSCVVGVAKGQAEPGAAPGREADREAIEHLIEVWVAHADSAWWARSAALMFVGIPETAADSVVIRTPEGGTLSRAANIADLQQRMDMTTRIDTMRTVVDSVRFLGADQAVAYTTQRFVRWMVLPGQAERQLFSGVNHRQEFERSGGRWVGRWPIQEFNRWIRWADDPN
jgi:SnoaL-like domain